MWYKLSEKQPIEFKSCIGKYCLGHSIENYAFFYFADGKYVSKNYFEETILINPPVFWMELEPPAEDDNDYLKLNLVEEKE